MGLLTPSTPFVDDHSSWKIIGNVPSAARPLLTSGQSCSSSISWEYRWLCPSMFCRALNIAVGSYSNGLSMKAVLSSTFCATVSHSIVTVWFWLHHSGCEMTLGTFMLGCAPWSRYSCTLYVTIMFLFRMWGWNQFCTVTSSACKLQAPQPATHTRQQSPYASLLNNYTQEKAASLQFHLLQTWADGRKDALQMVLVGTAPWAEIFWCF